MIPRQFFEELIALARAHSATVEGIPLGPVHEAASLEAAELLDRIRCLESLLPIGEFRQPGVTTPLRAQVTGGDAQRVKIELSYGGDPAVIRCRATYGAVYLVGGGLGPYIIRRPKVGLGDGRMIFTAGDDVDVVVIPAQRLGDLAPPLTACR